jgi:hypothetical protein
MIFSLPLVSAMALAFSKTRQFVLPGGINGGFQ